MAPSPKKTEHDLERVPCQKQPCRGSCPRYVLCRAYLPGSTFKEPVCKECNTKYPKPAKTHIQRWQRRVDEAIAATAETAKAPNGRRKQDQDRRSKADKAESDKVRKLEQEINQLKNKLEQKDTEEEEDEAAPADDEKHLAELNKEISRANRTVANTDLSEIGRKRAQEYLDLCKTEKAELERKRDEAKPHSSKVQRAETEAKKAKEKIQRVEEKLAAANKQLDEHIQAVKELKIERDTCAAEAADAEKYLAVFESGDSDRNKDGPVPHSPEHYTTILQSILAQTLSIANPEEQNVLRKFDGLLQQGLQRVLTVKAAEPPRQGAPAAVEKQGENSDAPKEPVPEDMDVASEEAYKRSMQEWFDAQPVQTAGQSDEECRKIREAWVDRAPQPQRKKPKTLQGKGDGQSQG